MHPYRLPGWREAIYAAGRLCPTSSEHVFWRCTCTSAALLMPATVHITRRYLVCERRSPCQKVLRHARVRIDTEAILSDLGAERRNSRNNVSLSLPSSDLLMYTNAISHVKSRHSTRIRSRVGCAEREFAISLHWCGRLILVSFDEVLRGGNSRPSSLTVHSAFMS